MTLAIFSLQFKALSAAIAAFSSGGLACYQSAKGARIKFYIASVVCAFLLYLTITLLRDLPKA